MQMHPNTPTAGLLGAAAGMVLSIIIHGIVKEYAYELLNDPTTLLLAGGAAGLVAGIVGFLAAGRVKDYRLQDRLTLGATGAVVCATLFTCFWQH